MKTYYKIKSFDSFTIFIHSVTKEEVDLFYMNDCQDVLSSTPTSLGFDKERGAFFIFEWSDYFIKASESNPFTSHDHFFRGSINPLTGNATLRLENFVGPISFRNQYFEVHSKKVEYDKVEKTVDFINERYSKLGMAYNPSGTSNSVFRKSDGNHNLFDQFVLIFSFLENKDFLKAMKIIMNNTHITFKRSEQKTKFIDIEEMSPETLNDIFSGDVVFNKTLSNLPISHRLKGNIPKEITTVQETNNNNNNENQFVLFLILKFINVLRKIKIQMLKSTKPHEFLVKKINKHLSELSLIRKSPFFYGVEKMNFINTSSTVLTRKVGYRQLYSFYVKLNSIPKGTFDKTEFIQFYENKSIDKLYEYSALFYFEDSLRQIYKVPPMKQHFNIKDKFFSISLNEGNNKVKFVFKRAGLPTAILSFQNDYSPNGDTAYATRLSPDFTLLLKQENNEFLYHFDTKFRSKNGAPKDDDFKIMHAYRDGINNSLGCFILYPGKENQKELLFKHPSSIDNSFVGVGAIPLRMGEENTVFLNFLTRVIQFHSK